ncbi:hypothetical protein B0A50_08510 [Salinomyces thailandicus]|uniref:RRM domain-containing protein n=1 Tax=Salinomyces thailandicus TaxID=706561 RepID=A0A4U0TJ58_9PEZI|nr:hypothetical protein B0A50_08510 [Salinomyces thailandica]
MTVPLEVEVYAVVVVYILRRVAARAISAQPSRQLSTLRPSYRATATPKPAIARAFHESRLWRADEAQQKDSTVSPTEASSSGETVTTEPSRAEEDIKEESIATPDVADGTQSRQPADSAHDAVSESSGTTSAPLGQSEAPSNSESVLDTVSDVAHSAAQTAQKATSSAAETAQDVASRAAAASPFGSLDNLSNASSGRRSSSVENRPTPEPSRILYVGNLFFEVTAPQLEAEMSRYGEISNARVVTDGRGLSKGFAYIEFATQEAATRAVKEMDQKIFQGRRVAVQYHVRRERTSPRPTRPESAPSKTLFIGNMSYQMSDKDLNDLFREIRNVVDVRVAIDRRSGQPRGFAHADFLDIASAERAKAYLTKKIIYGRQLKIDFSAESTYKSIPPRSRDHREEESGV